MTISQLIDALIQRRTEALNNLSLPINPEVDIESSHGEYSPGSIQWFRGKIVLLRRKNNA